MLQGVTDGVWMHQSECIETNGVVVQGSDGVLVVDPGLTARELECLAADIAGLHQPVVAGFSTHPDWDHVLWHPGLGDAPRYATPLGAQAMREFLARPDWQAEFADGLPPEIADEVPLALVGQLTALPPAADLLPWDGPQVAVLEHRGHAEGHAALFVAGAGVLIAGDMLSDVLVPMLDVQGSEDPIGDYLGSLQLFDAIADQVSFFVPGHGSAGGPAELRSRIDRDRAYVLALRDGTDIDDPRFGPAVRPGWEWVAGIHEWQVESLSARKTGATSATGEDRYPFFHYSRLRGRLGRGAQGHHR